MSALLIAAALTALSADTLFASPPLPDMVLAEQRGGFIRPGMAARRVIVDANAMSTFQLQAEVNRATFDNWFANEGTVLIVNNQLSALAR